MAHQAASVVSPIVKQVYTVGKLVYDRIQQMRDNNEECQRIQAYVEDLKKLSLNLKELEQDKLPVSCREYICKFQDALEICSAICSTMDCEDILTKVAFVDTHKKQLQNLEKELKRASENLQLVYAQAILVRLNQVKHQEQENYATILHPDVGIYAGADSSRPRKIRKPKVGLSEHGDLMAVKWRDKNKKVHRYELRYNDERNEIVSKKPCECKAGSSQYSIKLGAPKIRLGHMYTVQVRATNGAGPGEWSDPVSFRFKDGPPNRPCKPKASVQSPTEIVLAADRLFENDENGSPVTHCVTEYTTNGANAWSSARHDLANQPDIELRFAVPNLTPGTDYYFRIKMVNSAGESEPSKQEEASTNQLVPGPPREIRVSRVRKAKMLKLRWRAPTENQQAVGKYVAQIRPVKSRILRWKTFATVNKEKLSAKATGLVTNTAYKFRVCAVNDKNIPGQYSTEVQEETLHGPFAHTVGVASAFIGGTVGGPLIGASILGGAAAMAVHSSVSDDKPKRRKAAAIAAGVTAGAGGVVIGLVTAPMMGLNVAFGVHVMMSGSPRLKTSHREGTIGMRIRTGFSELVVRWGGKLNEDGSNHELSTKI